MEIECFSEADDAIVAGNKHGETYYKFYELCIDSRTTVEDVDRFIAANINYELWMNHQLFSAFAIEYLCIHNEPVLKHLIIYRIISKDCIDKAFVCSCKKSNNLMRWIYDNGKPDITYDNHRALYNAYYAKKIRIFIFLLDMGLDVTIYDHTIFWDTLININSKPTDLTNIHFLHELTYRYEAYMTFVNTLKQ
jgi:hypothetical protein